MMRPTTKAGQLIKAGQGKRAFVGTLIDTINKGKVRLAIFSVPKG